MRPADEYLGGGDRPYAGLGEQRRRHDPSQHPQLLAEPPGLQANAALYRIVIARLRHDQQTKDYLDRRIREGKSKKEAIRCLKRYVAREVFAVLQGNPRLQPAALPPPS
jgi:hypothetical protein